MVTPAAIRVALGLCLLLDASCTLWHDDAEREYLAALQGDENGMSAQDRMAHLDRAIAISPTRAHYWETRAIHKIDLLDFEGARADVDQAMVLQERPYLHFLRGLVLCQSGRAVDSLADFDAAIAGQPRNAQFYRGRSLARAALGQNSAALEDAERLIRLAPQMAESYYARGIALSHLGRDIDAIRDFSEALRRRPELVYPLLARAASYERGGDEALATADRVEAAKREPERKSCAACADPFRY